MRVQLGNLENPTKLSIFDAKGALLNTQAIESNLNTFLELNVANYPSGSYFIYLESNGMRKIKKFVKI